MAFTEADEITEMSTFDVERVDAVGSPANGTGWLLLKSAEKAKYSAEQLRKLYKQGKAMKGPHGNIDYPIADSEDLDNAIRAVGRGNGNHDAIRKYIIKRAKALGESGKIPDDWNSDGSLAKSESGEPEGWHVRKKAKVASTKKADGAPEPPEATSDAELPQSGEGSSLGSQSTDPGALEGQTMEVCAPVEGTSDQQERQDGQTQKGKKGKKKRTMRNHPDDGSDSHDDDAGDAHGDAEKASRQWEDTDVAIGKRTIAALQQALGLAQEFTNREETEARDASAKEINMTHEELVELVRQANADARAARKSERKAAKNAKAAKELKRLKKAVAETDAEPVERQRPVLAGAGQGKSAIKQLEDRVTEFRGTAREFDARKQLTLAKMIAVENGRQRGDIPTGSQFGPNVTPLLTGAHLIADDPTVRGV